MKQSQRESKTTFSDYLDTPIGVVSLVGTASALTGLSVDPTSGSTSIHPNPDQRSPCLSSAIDQLSRYFKATLTGFDIPLELNGTQFQMKVWNAIRDIPYGETATYGEVASWIGHPKAARAVGSALRCNPILIIVPCHRVIGAGAVIGGFKAGVQTKSELLRVEGSLHN